VTEFQGGWIMMELGAIVGLLIYIALKIGEKR